MIHDKKSIDLLVIDDSSAIIDIFKVITKRFDLKIKFAKNTYEFMDIAQQYNFKYVLCDLNLDYNYEGFFISRIYAIIRKYKNEEGKILLFTSEQATDLELMKFNFDGSLKKEFLPIYDFLIQNFPLRSIHDLLQDSPKYSIAGLS